MLVSNAITTNGADKNMVEANARHRNFGWGMRGLMRKEIWVTMVLSLVGGARAIAQGRLESTSFRPGSYVSFLSSLQQMKWDVVEAGAVSDSHEWTTSPGLLLRYAFHFQLLRSLGGVVGTDVSMHQDWLNVGANLPVACNKKGFRPGPSFAFPSMAVGLTQNFSESQRAMVVAQYTGVTFPWMKTCLDDGNEQLLAAIPHAISLLGQWDWFLESGKAVSVAAGYRYMGVSCVGKRSVCEFGAEKTSALEKLDISARGFLVQLGMTWSTGRDVDK